MTMAPSERPDEQPDEQRGGNDPVALFGALDIYLLDQLLRGRIRPGMKLFDAGAGDGRNLEYFLRAGYDVAGVDSDAESVERLRRRAAELAPATESETWRRCFRVAALETFDGSNECADVVVCNAVLHFARDEAHFDAMLRGCWSALRPGGLFFARLASNIGIETLVRPLGDGRHLLPDGSRRFLVDLAKLLAATEELGAELLDPIKTTNVQNLRAMTTWVVRRRPDAEGSAGGSERPAHAS
jgi:tellurite methyltransferase